MTNTKFINRPFEGTITHLVDNLFAELPGLFKTDFNESVAKGFAPVNVKETDESYEMEVIAPGFEKTDFKLNLDKNLLTVSAEKKAEPKNESDKQIRREFTYRSFKRTFTLDEKIDATHIDAAYINGVLKLILPKKEEVVAPATEITVK